MQGQRHRERRPAYRLGRRRLILMSVLMLGVFTALVGRAVYLTLGATSRAQANLAVMTRKPHSLDLLAEQTAKIKQVTAHMEAHSINEITEVLAQTSRIADQAALELQAQSDAAAKIRANATVDATVYLETQRKLNSINRLQSDEIVRLNGVLNQAMQPTWYASLFGYLLTFVGGVITTLLGDALKKLLVTWWQRHRAVATIKGRGDPQQTGK